ncbi:Glutathione peroxidase 2, partial [Coemansia sp. RSA 2559]
DYSFEQLRDKVVLVVNVASKCGFTPQYKGLEELYKNNKEKGLVVLGFPSNQFGKQEPGGAEEIQNFCSTTYGVSFPIMEKSDVNGEHENPVYAYLKGEKSGLLGLKRIKWNFEKFVINKRGYVVERYASTTTPKGIEDVIAGYLEQE